MIAPAGLGVRSLVGNDVVDLREPSHRASFKRPRYLERVCGPAELRRVLGSEDPEATFWGLFAAKEAAFKALTKSAGPFPLCYAELQVSADAQTLGWRGSSFCLRLEYRGNSVHALVWTGTSVPAAAVRPRPAGQNESLAARELLIEQVSYRLGLETSDLAIRRPPRPDDWDGYGPPELWYRGQRLAVDVSLSHDGGFVASALIE